MKNNLFKTLALSVVAALAASSAQALEPGVYQGSETALVQNFRTGSFGSRSTSDVEIVVAQDGSYTTNSPFLIRNGLANGQVDEENGMFHFSDSEDEIGFAEYGEDISAFLGFEGRGFFTTAGRTGARWDIEKVSDDVAEQGLTLEQKLLGSWNITLNAYTSYFSQQGTLQLNSDGTYETDLNSLKGRSGQLYEINGDQLILKKQFRSGGGLQSGGVGGRTSTNRVTFTLGEVSENQADAVQVRGIQARFFTRNIISANLSR